MNIIQKTSTYNTTWAGNRKIEYIVIHYTAGVTSRAGSAQNIASYFANPDIEASADFIVDDSNIVQYNPDLRNRYCWAVGGSKLITEAGGKFYGKATNKNTINIEICSSNTTGRITYANDKYFYFTDAVIKKAAELTRYLMQEYRIDINHVIRHYDVTGKYCPGVIGWNADSGSESKWQNFKTLLKNSTATTTSATQQKNNTPRVPYLVRVTADALNIRRGPGTNYSIAGCIRDKGVYTITQLGYGQGAKLWGKLKSGQGYISLDYTTFIKNI